MAPEQEAGSAAGLPHVTGAAGDGGAGEDLAPPEVPGAVGAEVTYPEVEFPAVAAVGEVGELSVVDSPVAGFVEGESVELLALRRPDAQVFQNPDGTRTVRLYDGVAFVPDPGLMALIEQGIAPEPGQALLQPVDGTLRRGRDGRVAPVRALPVSFGSSASDAELARVELESGGWVAFGLAGAGDVEPVVEDAVVTYPGVRPEADLRFTVSATAMKEEIVLHSADAPTSWLFRLSASGVTPSLADNEKAVLFTDSGGEIQGYIPPGFMTDSNVHPRRGDGEVSHGVTYGLEQDGDGWLLRVELDEAWLAHPAREFPVVVDPTYERNADSDDTYVSSRDHANQDNSWENELKVGTYDGGGNKAASYLDFGGLLSARPNRWVHGAQLNVYNHWSWSCTARPVDVYKVTKSWSGPSTKKWAGPAYWGNRLARDTFAYGYTSCPQGGWGEFELDEDRVMRWLHGTESFYGLTLRASTTDSRGWKRFWSSDYGTSSARPHISLNYSDQGAKYKLPTGVFDPPVTGSSAGEITVRVTNWGMSTWTPTNDYRLRVRVYQGSTLVQNVPLIDMPRNVGPHKSVDIPVEVGPLAPGSYQLRVYMVNPSGSSFQTAYDVPYAQSGFTVANGPPTIVGNWPAHNGVVDALSPSLWVDFYDPDDHPGGREYRYRACEGAPGGGGSCQTSSWGTSPTWQVPSGVASWHEPMHWFANVSDTQNSSGWIGPFVFTPTVAQPPVTSHLAQAPEGADVPGLNPVVGNYTTTVTDASVEVVGPALELTRSYNSQDPRTDGAFGPGWTSALDQRVVEDADGSGNVVVTLKSGRQLRFGLNPDGSYASPPGTNLTLVKSTWSSAEWTMRDAAGTRHVFTSAGMLRHVTDADGHTQRYTYGSGGELTRIENLDSGRGLDITWDGPRVRYVTTDPPEVGQPGLRWTYSYTDGLLTEVCTPLSAGSCTSYEYDQSSHYRSIVLDENPTGYWPLGETDGSVVASVAPGVEDLAGTYRGGVTLGVPGALAGSADVAVELDGGVDTAVELPRNLVNSSMAYAVELWFKAEPGADGVLFAHQSRRLNYTGSQNWNPMLYVAPDGTLRGKGYTSTSGTVEMVSPGSVDDGLWHHAVLSVTVNRQDLYLDGVSVDDVTGLVPFHRANSYVYVGNGRASSGWGYPSTTDYPFAGLVDEVAFYRHPLGSQSVAVHWAAGSATHRLTEVVEPGEFTATQVEYDLVTGRVSTLTDRHGEQWTLTEPALDGGEMSVGLTSAAAGTVTYTYDIEHGGRLVSREDTFGEQSWEYNDAGFVSKAIDANGNAATYATDERGNVVGRTTCRATVECATEYFDHFLNPSDPLDPRNDQLVWQADARSEDASDTTYRTTYELDEAGRVIEVAYPTPDGHTTPPTETFTYTTGDWTPPDYAVSDEPRAFIPANDTVLPISAWDDEVEVALPFPVEVYGAQNSSVVVDGLGALWFDVGFMSAIVCALCGYWEVDGSASVRTAVVGTAPDRQFVVEWRNIGHYYDMSQRVSAQVVISESGEIALNYADPGGMGSIPGFSGIFLGEFFDYVSPQSVEIADDTAVVFSPTSGGMSYTVDEEPGSFVSASTVLPLSGDDEVLGIDLPFPVTHYGVTYDEAWISTNGYVSFEEAVAPPGPFHWQTPLPSATEPNAAVYPLWEDFVVDASASVRTEVLGTAPNRTFVIEWRNAHVYGHQSTRVSFEVLLSEDGGITVNYDDVDELLTHPWFFWPMVGVENEFGDAAVEHLVVTGRPAGGIAQVFTPTTPGAGTPVEGLLEESVGVNGGVTTYEYNPRGDLMRTVDPVGLVEELTYDGLGRVTGVTTSDGTQTYGTTTYTYNALSQVEAVTAPAVTNPITKVTHTEVTTHTYDDAGRRTSTTVSDSTGGDTPRVWQWEYDLAGRLVKTTGPDGAVTLQEWDTRGDVVEVTEPGGLVLEHVYDGEHRLVETAAVGPDVDPLDPLATRLMLESRAYDPAGRLAAVTDAMGQETAYTYYEDNLPATVERVRRDEEWNVVDTVLLAEFEYNEAGMLSRSTNAGEVVTEYEYDPAGFLMWEFFDPSGVGRVRVYERNADGTVAVVWAAGAPTYEGRWEATGYEYDLAGRLLSETVDNTGGSVETLTTTFERDARGLVTLETDPAGTRRWLDYDDLGRLVSMTEEPRDVWSGGVFTAEVQPVSMFGRNTFGEVTHEQDPTGGVIELVLDEAGRSVELHLPEYTPPGGSPIQAVEYTQYDDRGLPLTETDALGRVTEYDYDVYGRLVSLTLPDPDDTGPESAPVWTYAYDRVGQLLETTDPTGGQSLATYDDLGRRVTETVTDRTTSTTLYLTTEFGHDDAGNPTSVTTPLGRTTTITYNAAGEPLRVTDPSGRFVEYGYDMAGRLERQVAGQGSSFTNPVVQSWYDLAGRQIVEEHCTVDSSGECNTSLRNNSVFHDAAGRPLFVGTPAGRGTEYGYDDAGQLVEIIQREDVTDPGTEITVELGYDELGRRSRMVDGNGNETVYTYMPWGLPETVVEPSTTAHPVLADRTWTWVYDAAGQQVQQNLPGGVTRTSTHDDLGRLIEETGTGAEATTSARQFGYDPLGRITSINRPDGLTTYEWDDRGLLVGATGAAGNASFTYSGDGQLVSRTDAAGTATFTHTLAGAVETVADPLTGLTATYAYDDVGRVESTSWSGGGATREYGYDDLGRLVSDEWLRPDTSTAWSAAYTWDDDDLVTGKTTTGVAGAGAHSYDYDDLGRLLEWTRPDTETITYGYDDASNLTTVDGPDGTRTFTYDQRNRLLSAAGGGEPTLTRTWTARGTLASSTEGTAVTTYAFDAFERLAQVTGPTFSTDYTYDALDRLATSDSQIHQFADHTNMPVAAPGDGGQVLITRTPEGMPLAAQVGIGPGYAILAEMVHGDVVGAADPATGTLATSASYDPYGEVTDTAGGTLPLGYQGGWTDPDTAQVNAHARWYDPGVGAFTSRDTWTLPPNPVAQTNRYLYGNANPITNTDPSGHCPICIHILLGAAHVLLDASPAGERCVKPSPYLDPEY